MGDLYDYLAAGQLAHDERQGEFHHHGIRHIGRIKTQFFDTGILQHGTQSQGDGPRFFLGGGFWRWNRRCWWRGRRGEGRELRFRNRLYRLKRWQR